MRKDSKLVFCDKWWWRCPKCHLWKLSLASTFVSLQYQSLC